MTASKNATRSIFSHVVSMIHPLGCCRTHVPWPRAMPTRLCDAYAPRALHPVGLQTNGSVAMVRSLRIRLAVIRSCHPLSCFWLVCLSVVDALAVVMN